MPYEPAKKFASNHKNFKCNGTFMAFQSKNKIMIEIFIIFFYFITF